MSLHIIQAGRVAPEPWRNGGGQTRELMTWPLGPDWQVRISVADITQDGPFSAWPGLSRWFTVIDGAGVLLGEPALRMDPHSPPHAFEGAEAPMCRLIDGPTCDLNLMVRHGAGLAVMHRARPGQPWRPAGAADLPGWRALFCADPGRLATAELGVTLDLPAMSLVWSPQACGNWLLEAGAECRAWWMQLVHPVAR